MRRPYYPWSLKQLLEGRPSVGSLLDLCEENYRHLLRLAPDLALMDQSHRSSIAGGPLLYLEIQEQTPYTTCLQLTYRFGPQGECDPAALLRAYHDARQLEVLNLRQRALPLGDRPDLCTLERKWKANLFMSKWLCYCCAQQHRFDLSVESFSLVVGQ